MKMKLNWSQPSCKLCESALNQVNYRFNYSGTNALKQQVSWADSINWISESDKTKSQTLNDIGLIWQLYLPNPLKPDFQSRMNM